jgi:hypothetical protein
VQLVIVGFFFDGPGFPDRLLLLARDRLSYQEAFNIDSPPDLLSSNRRWGTSLPSPLS